MSNEILLEEDIQMLKALYDFQATLPKTLSFSENDIFYFVQTNTKQRNWWHVVNKKGQVGFVPSNYVTSIKVEPKTLLNFFEDCIKNLTDDQNACTQKNELIHKLNEKKKQVQSLIKVPSKKSKAPQPPQRLDDCNLNGISPSLDLRPIVSQQCINEEKQLLHTSISEDASKENFEELNVIKSLNRSIEKYDEDSHGGSESVRPNAIYDIVQAVRKETQLSHEMSKVAVETVLISLKEFLPEGAARSVIDALLRETNSNITCPKNALDAAPDALRMITALNALSKAANDAQQRGWALHDDAHDIQTQLLELISVMSNADVKISEHILRSHRYAYVTTLVQYYQMETRWPLRQLLLQAFGVMCGLERGALNALATSALPADLARDMRDSPRSLARLSHSALLLSMLLSMADKLPVTHFEQLGVEFVDFLLEMIENPLDTDVDEQIPDLFLTLLLAYNLQFDDPSENRLLAALEMRDNAKVFCEKLLLLLNREEDPVRMFDHEWSGRHSVLALAADVFGHSATARLFYTNDVKVALDIVVRQLADLAPSDMRRCEYLKILQGIIYNTEYESHLHRRDDLERCFARLLHEEGESNHEDKQLVRAIIKQFPQCFKV